MKYRLEPKEANDKVKKAFETKVHNSKSSYSVFAKEKRVCQDIYKLHLKNFVTNLEPTEF